MALRTRNAPTTTTERTRLWPAVTGAPGYADIEDPASALYVPDAVRPAYVAFAGDPSALDGYTDRDLRENHTAALRFYGKALGEDVDRKPSHVVGARDRIVERDPVEVEAAMNARGLTGRGLWAHGVALTAAETATNGQRMNDANDALTAWRRTCVACGMESDTTRTRGDRVTGDNPALPPAIATGQLCDPCAVTALAVIAETARANTLPNGKTRAEAVALWLAAV